MTMQRHAVELGQHIDRTQPGIETIADGNVDNPIFPSKRHSRFGAILRQREQTAAGTTAHDDGKRSLGRAGRQRPERFYAGIFWKGVALRPVLHCLPINNSALLFCGNFFAIEQAKIFAAIYNTAGWPLIALTPPVCLRGRGDPVCRANISVLLRHFDIRASFVIRHSCFVIASCCCSSAARSNESCERGCPPLHSQHVWNCWLRWARSSRAHFARRTASP